jgi:Fur family transcriptional regulator, zinc uptake regulator
MLCYIIAMNAHHHSEPKLSRNQGQVLSTLRKAKEPLSAYAILDRVRATGISHPPTVYRALNELIQLGMVHRLESRSAFVACGHGACDGKAAFAICRKCQKVVEIPLSQKKEAALLALSPKEIAPERVTLEIAGLCAACEPAGAN